MVHYHETQQNTTRIARTARKVDICGGIVRSIAVVVDTRRGYCLPLSTPTTTCYRSTPGPPHEAARARHLHRKKPYHSIIARILLSKRN
jgi:hypothetical protein